MRNSTYRYGNLNYFEQHHLSNCILQKRKTVPKANDTTDAYPTIDLICKERGDSGKFLNKWSVAIINIMEIKNIDTEDRNIL